MTTGQNTTGYETPNHPYQGERIAEESGLIGRYGLKNKEELWRAQSELRSIRREARRLIGEAQGDTEVAADAGSEFLAKLRRYGILDEHDTITDVLSLEVTDILERRLQTVVYREGLASTPTQARQFIAHGHITLGGARATTPGRTIEVAEESTLSYDETSPLADELHPARAEAQE
ncbi:MAG: ribosomal protein S4 [Halonotius sp. J07HN6]|jgi:SSU ribosomal protein S4P|nr:MAG: ribosomal protein S4 [Halonotius sp. J07HN6]ERH05483.1 MAG: ribosomal protein S4 [Halonotius sp. J07HN4]ESS09503.1 MAG: SSU ribosomal protein S4P [uncultured archaeon A07HN63]